MDSTTIKSFSLESQKESKVKPDIILKSPSQQPLDKELEDKEEYKVSQEEKQSLLSLQNELVTGCEQGNLEVVQTAIRKGAKPDEPNTQGKLPLGAAVWGMNPEVVNLLLTQKWTRTLMTWEECEQHNLKFYNKQIFIVEAFSPQNFSNWNDLLQKIDQSIFLRDSHLREADQTIPWDASVKCTSSWDALRQYVKKWITQSYVEKPPHWHGKTMVATERVYADYRKQIKRMMHLAIKLLEQPKSMAVDNITLEAQIGKIDRRIQEIDERLKSIDKVLYQELLSASQWWSDNEALQRAIKKSMEAEKSASAIALAANAKKFGYQCEDVPREGNCFYHSISEQLKREAKVSIPHQRLRELTVQHVLENVNLYSAATEGSMHTFIDRMSQPGEWADGVHVQALSRALNVNLVIIRSDDAKPTIVRRATVAVPTLYLGYHVGLHYQSLSSTGEATANHSLKHAIEKAAEDSEYKSELSLTELRMLGDPVDPPTVQSFRDKLTKELGSDQKSDRFTFKLERSKENELCIYFTAVRDDDDFDFNLTKKKLKGLVEEFKKAAESSDISAEQYTLKYDFATWRLIITAESDMLDKIALLLQKVTEPKYFMSQMKDALFYKPVREMPKPEEKLIEEGVVCRMQ